MISFMIGQMGPMEKITFYVTLNVQFVWRSGEKREKKEKQGKKYLPNSEIIIYNNFIQQILAFILIKSHL